MQRIRVKNKFLLSFFLLFYVETFSAEIIKEGVATFDFDYPDASSISQERLSIMPKGLTIYFKNGKSRVEYDNPSRWVNIVDGNKKEILSMGTAAHDNASKWTMKQKEDNQALEFGKYTVQLTNEMKDIAGYQCLKAVVKYTGNQTMEVWFTRQIAATNTQYFFKGIDGFIMQYTHQLNLFSGEDFTEILTCTKVVKTAVSNAKFKLPANCKVFSSERLIKPSK